MTAILWFFANGFQCLFVALWTLLWLLIALAARLVTGRTDLPLALAHHPWSTTVMAIAGARLVVSGRDHLIPGQQYFLAVNHQSMLDIPVLYQALTMPLLFVLKEELGKIPVFGTFVRAMGMVLIKRQARRQAVQELMDTSQRLAEGHCLVAFPEGTRGSGDAIQPFKPGVFVPAIDAQVPIIPIALDGPAHVLPRNTLRIRPGLVRLAIGPSIPTDGLERGDRRQLAQEVEDAVRRQWQELRSQDSESIV